MKGPKPVWTSATKKLSQSSPRSLRRSTTPPLLPVDRGEIRGDRGRVLRRRDGGEDRPLRLVFGEVLELLPVQREGDRARPLAGREGQRPPGHGDPALAHAEEAAVVEDRGARCAGGVHQQV